ncbi:MAG: hypothetical protein Q9212_001356 [Teloschistes hypoglaucus]
MPPLAKSKHNHDRQPGTHALPRQDDAAIRFTTGPFAPPTSTQFPPPAPLTAQSAQPRTSGSIVTVLETEGRSSQQPFPTPTFTTAAVLPAANYSSKANNTLPTHIANSTLHLLNSRRVSRQVMLDHTEALQPMASGPPPRSISWRSDHPVPRTNIASQDGPLATNKFYANFFLGSQHQGVWTHPYSLTWSKGTGYAQSWGMTISHLDADQRVFGPPNSDVPGHPAKYFINPLAIQSIILSAAELGSSTVLTTDSLQAFSVNANLLPYPGSLSKITFPLLQGMAFVTGVYSNLQPLIQSSVFFRSVSSAASSSIGIFKYVIVLEDGKQWLLYATPSNGQDPRFSLVSQTMILGVPNWFGHIQVAKNPAGSPGEYIYDNSAGVYPVAADLTASKSAQTGTYQIQWKKAGLISRDAPQLLMFALPHHVESFGGTTPYGLTALRLQTTTKGTASGVIADSWTLVEPSLPVDMGFSPWDGSLPLGTRSAKPLSSRALTIIRAVAASEIQQDMDSQTNLDSMYFSGKALSKFATIIYTVHDLCQEPDLAQLGLSRLKMAFAKFSTNQQIFPLVYDTVWKGVVSSGAYRTRDPGQDFGNTYYNDHHFHYGYFIHAAAIIAYLDPQWLVLNKEFVDILVRDTANPSSSDPYFPFSRTFDWYHGHSWAKGLFESADGKDEESSSEDALFAYAIKMWGRVTGDKSMEARGNLMLAVLARTLRNYFLMQDGNANQPANFIGNKVTGIRTKTGSNQLFENKVDATTYFGNNLEYVHGIHMMPLLPYSALTRPSRFAYEEWSLLFDPASPTAPAPASSVQGGWRGILYANLALIDPQRSWEFFAQPNFDMRWIDGGASRTWYLAWAAGEVHPRYMTFVLFADCVFERFGGRVMGPSVL